MGSFACKCAHCQHVATYFKPVNIARVNILAFLGWRRAPGGPPVAWLCPACVDSSAAKAQAKRRPRRAKVERFNGRRARKP